MNDDKKPSNVKPGSLPDLSSGDEDNPWEDENEGRTLAMEGPSFEVPSNIPSPITVPPPPGAAPPPPPVPSPVFPNQALPKRKPQATMIGFGPPGPALPSEGSPPAPVGPAAPAAPVTAPAPVPVAARVGPVLKTAPAFPPVPLPSASAKSGPAAPLGGSTLQASPAPAPPSSPDIASSATAPSPAKRAAPMAPRPGGLGGPPSSGRGSVPLPSSRAGQAPAVTPSRRSSVPDAAPTAPLPSTPSSDRSDAWQASEATRDSQEPRPQRDQQEDSPTMAVPSPRTSSAPVRDDTSDAPLPSLNDNEGEADEATRAVPREDLIRSQDAHIVVGADAMGDEATLAVAPGHVDGLDPAVSAALMRELEEREAQPAFPQQQPFGQPHQHISSGRHEAAAPLGVVPQPLGMGMAPVVPSWGEPAPAYRPPQQQMPPGFDPGYDPMLQQSQGMPYGNQGMQGFPQSGQHPVGQPMPMGMYGGQGGYGPNPNDPQARMSVQGPQGPQGQQPWLAPQAPHAPQAAAPSAMPKLTPQVILLVAVGAVCLAIFVIGIVLFVTTKF